MHMPNRVRNTLLFLFAITGFNLHAQTLELSLQDESMEDAIEESRGMALTEW